tara:strand:- start:401 stop:646 length:246 start_codon:yes stop_codon:yes gene_type:complete
MKDRKVKNKVWYVKWSSSIVLMTGMIFTAQNIFPYNLYLHTIGIIGWVYVSIVWNDRALIVVNSVALSIFLNGILATLFDK